ncbi:MAG: hypothetical protein JWO09_3458 [Bacteroidetes bacterium]|nr:hypothetical protein [Bacteroidota bacterium]
MACSIFTARAQYSITNYQSATVGITENYPVDIEYNPFNRQYNSLHSNSVGMSVVNFDGLTGARLSSLNFFKAGNSFGPVKIIHNGVDSYILFSFMSGSMGRFAICKYNNSTNAIQWVKQFNNSTNTLDVYPVDMALDPSGNCYVIGHVTSSAGDQDIFISAFNSLGTWMWYNQYNNTTYDESPNNITYDAGSGELIVGGTAIDVSNWLNRNALVWRVNTSGTILVGNLLAYSTSGPRLNGCCAKRSGAFIYLTATSILGADYPGPFIVAKLAPLTLLPVTYKVYSGPTYFNPEFNFTNNGNHLIWCGSASFVNTGTPGMVNTMFSLSTCLFTSEARYTTVGSFAWGGPMYNTYGSTYNELGSVIQDPITSSNFYFVKSRYDGYTSCDVNATYSLQSLTLVYTPPAYTITYQDLLSAPIKLFSVQAMEHVEERSCYYNPCPLCEYPAYGGNEKSMEAPETPAAALSIYPNPANDQLNIVTADEKVMQSVEMYDMSGRLIVSEKNVAAATATFNVSGLDKAVYMLKITYTDGSSDVKRFAKE